MRSLPLRLLAATVVALLAAACVPALVIVLAPQAPDHDGAPIDVAAAPDGVEAPPDTAAHAGSAVPELPDDGYTLDEPRPRLRSFSTAPTRPRLADRGAGGSPPEGFQARHARVRIDDPAPGALAATRSTDGVAFATAVFVGEVLVRHDGGRERLSVAFVHPGGFRVFAPRVTAEAEPLWQGLADGDLAVTHEAARRIGLRAGDGVALGPLLRRTDARVGATVSLGPAGIADAIFHVDARDTIAAGAEPTILVSVDRLGDVDTVVNRLEAAGVGDVTRLADIEPYRAELIGDDPDTVAAFEPFTFRRGERGRILMDPDWIDRHIVKTTVPVLGEVTCHRLILPQVRAALDELVDRGLDDLLDPSDYGGCWFPRHIGWDDTRALSMHAWGIAFDVNVHTNLMGDEPRIDPRVVEVFERHGFNWGGRWRTPDGMHFELGELRDP